MAKLKLDGKAINAQEKFNAGIWFPIRLDGEPIGLELKLLSRFSDTGEKLSRAAVRLQRAEFQKTGKFNLPDPVDADAQKLDYVTALVTDWRGSAIADESGAVPPFSQAGLVELLSDNKWMIEQVDKGIADDARFLKA